VALAAGTTAAMLGVLAVYGWTTQRDLAGLGRYLFIDLIGY
jgi:FtsH-binding integral membrane protein